MAESHERHRPVDNRQRPLEGIQAYLRAVFENWHAVESGRRAYFGHGRLMTEHRNRIQRGATLPEDRTAGHGQS